MHSYQELVAHIRASLKEAMRARDEVRATTLKGVLAALTNEAVALGKTPQSPLTLDEAHKVIRRLIKQREEAREIYAKQGRTDLAEREQQEALILSSLLPPALSEEEIRAIVARVRAENPQAHGGQLIGLVMREVSGRAEGSLVRRIVEEATRQS